MDLILIGMPGCGKTTIGRFVAMRLGYELCDVDEEIVRYENKSINEIFEQDGEEYFRQVETEVFRSLVGGNSIIATGGGIVTRDENYYIAKRGYIVFIDRSLDDIIADVDTDARPLLKEGAERLRNLYEQRYEKYSAWADVRVENNGTIEEVVDKIVDCFVSMRK